MSTHLVQEGTDHAVIEPEPPELQARNLRTGSHLWSSATVFFFVGFLFAFFYLRILNNAHLWRPKGVTPPLGLVALALQCVEYATLDFGPSSGGYASVFVGWTGLYALFVLGGLFWLETLLATSFRYRGRSGIAPGEGAGDSYRRTDDIEDPLALVLPGLEAFFFFWVMLAIIGVVTYILLYAVR